MPMTRRSAAKHSNKPVILVCLDGCSWEYISSSKGPNLMGIEQAGTIAHCKSMVPTVTNVNNASILTGEFPKEHGITGNYYFEKSRKSMIYMDSPSFLECKTLLEMASSRGQTTLFLTVKDKLRRLLGRGVTTSFSVEKPPAWILKKLGSPPNIYSSNSSVWLIDSALEVLKRRSYDMVFISTTDYVFHKFAPGSEVAREYIGAISEKIGQLGTKDIVVGIVSDHGMNKKRLKVDLEKLLSERRLKAKMIPIIKDEYEEHHQNLGGAVYIYLEKRALSSKAAEILRDQDGVEAALTRNEAVRKFHLPTNRIGDLLVLGNVEAVFSHVDKGLYEDVDVRSHGSLHEQEVPFILNRKQEITCEFNKDAFSTLWSLEP